MYLCRHQFLLYLKLEFFVFLTVMSFLNLVLSIVSIHVSAVMYLNAVFTLNLLHPSFSCPWQTFHTEDFNSKPQLWNYNLKHLQSEQFHFK